MQPTGEFLPRPRAQLTRYYRGRAYTVEDYESMDGMPPGTPVVGNFRVRLGTRYLNCTGLVSGAHRGSVYHAHKDAVRAAEAFIDANPPESPLVRTGLTYGGYFCVDGTKPADRFRWTTRDAVIEGAGFRQFGVVAPESWSDRAVTVVASKYFYGDRDKIPSSVQEGGRETSVGDVVGRVVDTVSSWARDDGYFCIPSDCQHFKSDLEFLCLDQRMAFNSPVWFNCGLYAAYGVTGGPGNFCWNASEGKVEPCQDVLVRPQISACFIQSVEDNMASIMELGRSEAMLFKYGSGTGTDLSPLRSTKEKLRGGGRPSGPVSFLRIYDAIASVIKSGGVSRRAAKMNTLRDSHPDVRAFAQCKAKEDGKARALVAAGYSDRMTGHEDEAYASVAFQNANLSVRLSDSFMRMLEEDPLDPSWPLYAVTEPTRVVERIHASSLMNDIAEGTWQCGDPGVQYHDTINSWHTCPNTAPINSSNPCSEYMFIDDSACNLASVNLLKFLRDDNTFNDEAFRAAVRCTVIAMDALVDRASYPTAKIAENSHRFRPLGLGYANLGAMLMAMGLPYDSRPAREVAGAVTSLMHAQAYLTSAELARSVGPFDGFEANREPMIAVVERHYKEAEALYVETADGSEAERLASLAANVMEDAWELGRKCGYRNSQVTLLAPTGTIAFMMDCDTTGVEPCLGLVVEKQLAGGGSLRLVNRSVPRALRTLGYESEHVADAMEWLERVGSFEGYGGLDPEHVPVFDCAFPAWPGGRSIGWRGHLAMMAAVQPFLSGAISKTVNMPEDSTVDDVRDAYVEGWKLGLKSLAVFRDNSKGVQPVSAARPIPQVKFCGTVLEGVKQVWYSERGMDGASPLDQIPDDVMNVMMSPVDLTPPVKGAQWQDVANTTTVQAVMALKKAAAAFAVEEYTPEGVKPVTVPGAIRGYAETVLEGTARELGRINSCPPLYDSMRNDPVISEGEKALGGPAPCHLGPRRERLPDTRRSVTHKFSVAGHEGYMHVGLFPDGRPGELFITMAKEGSTIGGLMDALGTAVAIALQYGVPLEVFVEKFKHGKFEPRGWTPNPAIREASSLTDYVFRWLELEFLAAKPQTSQGASAGATTVSEPTHPNGPATDGPGASQGHHGYRVMGADPAQPGSDQTVFQVASISGVHVVHRDRLVPSDTAICPNCGGLAYRRGNCHTCETCGTPLGCS